MEELSFLFSLFFLFSIGLYFLNFKLWWILLCIGFFLYFLFKFLIDSDSNILDIFNLFGVNISQNLNETNLNQGKNVIQNLVMKYLNINGFNLTS